jgi:hypothetical protein
MKKTRPNPNALRTAVLACGLALACCAAAAAQRRDTGVWDPSAKPKPKPTTKPRPKPSAPRPQPAPRARPLDVQYRLLKVNRNNSHVEVSPVTVFNGGDRLRLAVKAGKDDEDVYLFVIHQRGPTQPGSVYFPDTRVGAQNHIDKGEELVFPSDCPDAPTPADCSFEIDGARGQELFTLIFSRSESIPLIEKAGEAGGTVSAAALDEYVGGLAQKLDTSTRGDTVFARRFHNRNPKSAGVVVVRLVINKRG